MSDWLYTNESIPLKNIWYDVAVTITVGDYRKDTSTIGYRIGKNRWMTFGGERGNDWFSDVYAYKELEREVDLPIPFHAWHKRLLGDYTHPSPPNRLDTAMAGEG